MRAGAALAAAVLLIFTFSALQVSSAGEDLYLEGEEDGSMEFLEVKEKDSFVGGHLRRLKRDLWSWWDSPDSSSTTENYEVETEDPHSIDEDEPPDDNDLDNEGSGLPESNKEPEPKEKTLRVTFVVIRPYQTEYSNRDSVEFRNFSRSLADAVNMLYDGMPGTHRASLVRIQSLISDNFSCKVTLDIITTGVDDTDRTIKILQDHIRTRRRLGEVVVRDDDFSATVVDPGDGRILCAVGELQCDDGHCVAGSARCDGHHDCLDFSDETGCVPGLPWVPAERGHTGVPGTDQRVVEVEQTTTPPEPSDTCLDDELRCDVTRCVPLNRRCDGQRDCYDGADEAECELCGSDDFRCNNGKCIESSKRCNRIVDCPGQEDEQGCVCRADEFRCHSDGSCIENRKQCDGVNNCPDNSDEADCACGPDKWQCDHGSCIKRSLRCDGRVDCPTDRSDERNCIANGYFRCRSGKLITDDLRCNRRYDCPAGDYSDEQNCPCGVGDFQCDNSFCIPASKHCDRTHDCQDGSDERDCVYGVACMASQHKCTNGQCVRADSVCNGTVECGDGSDEDNCPCKRGEFKCHDGFCISLARRCDGQKDCRPNGEDEFNCDTTRCSADSFACDPSSRIPCATRCDGRAECDGGEDEDNCEECSHRCDGNRCIEDGMICDGQPDCADGSDELECDKCDGPDDFRCNSGECLNAAQHCNGVPECSDYSDEDNCNDTMITSPHGCSPTQFQCRDGSCVNGEFRCDKHPMDCLDNSDEENCVYPDGCSPNQFQCRDGSCIAGEYRCDIKIDCVDGSDEENCAWYVTRPPRAPATPPPAPCHESEFTCYDGRCIPHSWRCDNIYDCSDFSDEQNCLNSGEPVDCDSSSFTCMSGQCIDYSLQCDNKVDCSDGSDEMNCPTTAKPWTTTPYQPPYQPPYPPYRRPYEPYRPPYQPPREVVTSRPDYLPPPPTTQRPVYTTSSHFEPPRQGGPCNRNQWRCENGPCIDTNQRCDGHVDCPYDSSDELDCPAGSPVALNLKTYPSEQTIRNGGDVVFRCRDEGPQRAAVRWVREGGRSLKPGYSEKNGRLEINKVSVSDGGTYICQAVRYLGHPGSELRVQLTVDPQIPAPRQPFPVCEAFQATCGNGQCISKSAVCDGKNDCSDHSDEDNCNQNGKCEPNQFQCRNGKCILKTWICDSEDDCGDRSDEDSCGPPDPLQMCQAVEFKCDSGDQCVPKSFHCDGQSDCTDGSDETGCAPVYVTKPPSPANLRLNIGESLTLVCEAVGMPIPLISWRLNWGHVPPKCTTASERGIGNLACPNMQPEDSGAYSCEAINNRGSSFAATDAIVFVNTNNVCPSGYFNSEARSQTECIRCFCFGESKQCRSADLFTYNMPTPLGEGGTRLVGIAVGRNGEVELDSQPITNKYYYEPLRNGATVTKLANFNPGWGYDSSSLPYLTLPETYNGNQLTSYGGQIKYRLAPHSSRYDNNDDLPTIIIKGKYESLVHRSRGGNRRDSYIEARLTPENWHKSSPRGLVPATREDIMMALDNIEMILLRAEMNNAGVNITDFSMESAQHINVGLGAASLVEECTCPPGYEGLSCQKCASGYVRIKSGQWLGNCVREQKPCPPGSYGDPSSGYGCRPCPCPLTSPQNQFARTCSIAPGGGVNCDCPPGYGGRNCEYCERGYIGNPMIPGDYCKPEPQNSCNPVGTLRTLLPDECQCKDQVEGRYCDQCKADSFFLSEDFRHGCALCFCTGVSQQCSSSNLRRKTTTVRFNTPQIVDQVKVYSSAPLGAAAAVTYNAPVETELRPTLLRHELALRDFDRTKPTIYYWSLPAIFAGDKVTSYGGNLQYTLRYVTGGQSSNNNAADVQLISDNRLTFHFFGNFIPSGDGTLNATVQFLEKGWHRSDGKEISREHFLLALADVKAILIKATFSANSELASLESASIDTAEPNGNGPLASHVEQCVCPPGYVGSSCEDCAPGYTRSSSGLYLEHCELCDCNAHSTMCHPETGVCYDCKDDTDGDNCELCAPGYDKNEYGDCERSSRWPDTTPGSLCDCDSRGETAPCETTGYCNCKRNVEGDSCDTCRPGTFGLDGVNPEGCLPCYCSGVTNQCHEADRYSRIPIAAPIFGDNYGGYSLTDLNAERVINDQFVPAPNESELTYMFTFPPDGELYWSLPVFPGNRLLSYGGTLSLTQSFRSRYPEESTPSTDVVLVGDSISIYWTNPKSIRSDEPLSYQVPLREAGWFLLNSNTPASHNDFMVVLRHLRRVLVRATLAPSISATAIADVSMDTATETYDPNSQSARGVEVCMCPEGYSGTSCETCLTGYYKDRHDRCAQCNCNGHDCRIGPYDEIICSCRPPYTGSDCSVVGGESVTNITSRPPPAQPTVIVRITSPSIRIQEVGSSVNFTCQAQSRNTFSRLPITWSKVAGYLPRGRSQIDQNSGLLLITNLQPSDSGTYICETTDGVSSAQATASLKVPGVDMTLPTVTIEPAVNEYYEGDRVELRCITSGNPTPSVTWQRATNHPLPLSSETYASSFVIERAREEDSGEYRCIASNPSGSVDRTAVITVRQRPSWPLRDRLTVTPTASTVTEGQSMRLVCTATANVPAGTIDWIRQDGSQFLSNVRSDNGVLYIEVARPENQGVYICQTSGASAAPVPVLVTIVPLLPLPSSEQPSINIETKNLTIPTGGSGSVNCIASGYPLPLVKWKKHNGQFGPSVSQRDNALIIGNAQEDDGGYYICEGTVSGQVIQHQYVYLEIERRIAPRVEIWPRGEQAVNLGTQFELHCRVMEGVPEPDVTWDRNGGRTLSTFAQIQPHNILRFEKIEVNDEGEYTCSATSIAGTHSASAVLKVRAAPEISIRPSNFIETVLGDRVNVECRASGYPEPLVSITSNEDQREIVPQALGIAVLRIESVSERDGGDYVCTATSAAGTIQEQFAIRVGRGDTGFFDNGGSGENEINSEYPPYPNNEASNQIAFEGQDKTIQCQAAEGASVIWRRTDAPLQRNAIQSGNVLFIRNASTSDSGEYECSVVDPYTGEAQQAVYTRLQVVSVPRITLQPKTQTVLPGQSPTVQCLVEGDDIIDVTWRPVNRPLSSRVEVRGPTLIFHQIEVEDAGQYECFARNRYVNKSATAEVIVSEENDRDTAESHENEQYAHVGAAVQLSCNLTRPNLRMRWLKDGRKVPRSVQKRDGSLFIRLAQKSDSGQYVCIIQDEYGRETRNFINLHIEGIECSESQFRCYDNSICIEEVLLCDSFKDCPDNSDEENCLARDKRLSYALADSYADLDGSRDEQLSLVTITQPRRAFRVGDNVEVLCRTNTRGTRANWERYNNQQRQYVDARNYGDGSMLYIRGVEQSDAGVYRCTGEDAYGRTSYEDFNLEVQPVSIGPAYPINEQSTVYTANLGSIVDLPCNHNLEQPVQIEWTREFTPLPENVRKDETNLHLERVSEADAGTYVCRVSNVRAQAEARAILRVVGVVPLFEGDSWLSLPTLKDAFRQFDIEVSFKPKDANGLILYNSQDQGRNGKYVALQLVDGVPQFALDTGSGAVVVDGDRPLQLNAWHTIRISRTNSKVTMDVDNFGPFVAESSGQWGILELYQPLYIGGVPDYNQLPSQLAGASGFIGCVSMLVLGREETNIMVDSIEKHNVKECDSCAPNLCQNDGVCQEARNERGFMCLCASGYAGLNCDRPGESCRPGLCGPGKCSNTVDGYKCACPVTYTGRNCDVKQSIEYPAFTGSAYLAIKTPQTFRTFRMSMKIKATAPVTDGIIMYCAESPRGYGGFMSLAVHDSKLEFRYNVEDGSAPVILTANRTLPAGEWTDVHISRMGPAVSLKVNVVHEYEARLVSPRTDLHLETPMFVGGVDDSIVLNNQTGVTGGFCGCIKDVMVYGDHVDIVNSSILSANVQECSNDDRGDIPDTEPALESVCSRCRNGGYCASPDATACVCQAGYTGLYCEQHVPASAWRRPRQPARPCDAQPCRNGGSCRQDFSKGMNYSCDCPLPYAGANCHIHLELLQSVGFNGNGYIELPSELLHYENLPHENIIIALAFYTTRDGVLLYQREALAAPDYGDYILLHVQSGRLVLDWDFGSGSSSIKIDNVYVTNGERHQVIITFMSDNTVSVALDQDQFKTGTTAGFSNIMNADSNVYIGGIPDRYNVQRYPGLSGCIEQVELMDNNRGLNLGQHAVAGRNPQKCRDIGGYS